MSYPRNPTQVYSTVLVNNDRNIYKKNESTRRIFVQMTANILHSNASHLVHKMLLHYSYIVVLFHNNSPSELPILSEVGISHSILAKNRTLPAAAAESWATWQQKAEMAETCFGVHLGCTSACISYCKVIVFYLTKWTISLQQNDRIFWSRYRVKFALLPPRVGPKWAYVLFSGHIVRGSNRQSYRSGCLREVIKCESAKARKCESEHV